jgi:hypothetical protein
MRQRSIVVGLLCLLGCASPRAQQTTVSDLADGIKALADQIKLLSPQAPPEPEPPPVPTGAYPTPDTTGVPSGVVLRSCGSSVTLSTAGQVVSGCIYTGTVTVTANNVTIRNSEIHGKVSRSKSGSFTIEDSTVGPPTGCSNADGQIQYSHYTARRVKVRNTGDAFRVSGPNVLIEDSFVLLCSRPGDHSDGVQGYGGGNNVVIRHNTIDQRPAADVTSPIFFADKSRSAVVQNNLIMGGGYSLRIHDDANPDVGPWVVAGNRIVDGSWRYGPASTTNTNCSTMTWSDNRLVTIDAGYSVTSLGAVVPCQ